MNKTIENIPTWQYTDKELESRIPPLEPPEFELFDTWGQEITPLFCYPDDKKEIWI